MRTATRSRRRFGGGTTPATPWATALGWTLAASVTAAFASSTARAAAPAYDGAFWKTWGDGKAEIDGYALVRDRYGEKRTGTVVAVFVTEPWSVEGHVKADEGKHAAGDVMQVLKLNLVEDFQTGIYDYNLMTSSWIALTAPGDAAGRARVAPPGWTPKVAFSSQEWCGTTYTDVVFDARGRGSEVVRSYFDGETGAHVLAPPAGDALVEDALLTWARGLAAPVVAPGASATVAFLPALARARLLHRPLAWTTATLSRAREGVVADVPAGRIPCHVARVEVDGGRRVELCVEDAAPHRVARLTSSDGTSLALTGSLRTPYWKENHEGDERLLNKLGLHPPRSR